MSRKRRQQSDISARVAREVRLELERAAQSRTQSMVQAQAAKGANPASYQPIPDAVTNQMLMNLGPQVGGTPYYAPGAPIRPIPGITPPEGPRQYEYMVGYNIAQLPRNTEDYSFDQLRNLSKLYYGIQLCVQTWMDYISRLELVIEPLPELVKEDMDESVFANDIATYHAFFESPDKQRDLKSWLRMGVRDQLELDAVALYVHKNRAGGVYSLELLDGASIKPLVDDRGMRPLPPFPAYQQFLYGVPVADLTAEELLYLRETERTESVYGLSRVERIIMIVNQALRKQSKDLLRFTDGTVPAGVLELPSDFPWSLDQIEAYEQQFNALLAGNDQARARVKMLPRGVKFVATDPPDIMTALDQWLLNVTAACFGLTMDELGMTGSSNRSVGQTQENVVYRRAMQPLIARYEDLLTHILRRYFGERRFRVRFKGFEEVEDFQAQVNAYIQLVSAGIQSPTQAAQALHLPVYDDLNVPPFVLMKDGPFVISDLANTALRDAMTQAKLSGLQLAQQGQKAQASGSQPVQPQQDDGNDEEEDTSAAQRADYRRWRDRAIDDVKANRSQRDFITTTIPAYTYTHIKDQLSRCTTPDDVRAVFAGVKQQTGGECI